MLYFINKLRRNWFGEFEMLCKMFWIIKWVLCDWGINKSYVNKMLWNVVFKLIWKVYFYVIDWIGLFNYIVLSFYLLFKEVLLVLLFFWFSFYLDIKFVVWYSCWSINLIWNVYVIMVVYLWIWVLRRNLMKDEFFFWFFYFSF